MTDVLRQPTASDTPRQEKSLTGVPGLDSVMGGGYPSQNMFLVEGLIAHDAPFIEKPFTAAGLAQSVRGVLTGVRPSPQEEHARQ
jgi:hypothetical protein